MAARQGIVRSTLGVGAVLGAGTAALGAGLSLGGRESHTLDVWAHFAPLYGLAAIGVLALSILARLPFRRTSLAFGAAALCASAVLVIPEFVRTTGPVAATDAPGQIKVIQINARRANADIARIADWVIAQQPDVVTITEARHDLRDLILRRTGWRTAGAHGDLIIFTPEQYALMNRPRVDADLAFVNATYRRPDGPMEVATTHVGWPTWPETPAQVRGLERAVRALPRDRLILTGDFNATPWSAQLRGLDQGLGLTRRDRAIPTWPARVIGRDWPLPVLPIDHVYAGPGWATVKVERGPNVGSDHYPLIVTLAPASPR